MKPGIYDLPEGIYHADPCPAPSLSASIARELLGSSPWHAWHAHPRLNPAYQARASDRFDLGSAAHAHLLEGRDHFAVIDAPDWRTKAAQAERDAARAAGKVPLLAETWTQVQAMAEAARVQLDRYEEEPRPFTGGQPERTLVWQEPCGVWCRARLDWLHDDGQVIDDYKTTAASANPEEWGRRLLFSGPDFQAAFYLRGVRAVLGTDARFRFVVQETKAPYALSVVGLGPDVLALAQRKVALALDLWGECLRTGRWPGYPTRTCYAELPPWMEARWLEREEQEESQPFYGRAG